MSVRDVKEAIAKSSASLTRPLDDGEVQIIVRAGRAQVTVSANKNQVTVSTDKTLLTDKIRGINAEQVFFSDEEVLGSAVMVLSQINEA
jgi:hypothetical protein